MKIYIYCIYFLTSNKYYVGQTKDLERRMKEHLKSGNLICKALWKYDDWTIEILHTTKDRDTANLLEIEEIRHYDCVTPNGYNITRGGNYSNGFEGHRHTEESIKKMRGIKKPGTSKAMRGSQNAKGYKHTKEWKQNKSIEMQSNKNSEGHKHSKETKEKISKSQKGSKKPGTSRAVIKHNKENNPMKNPIAVLKMRRTKLKNHIAQLEREMGNE